MHRSEVELAPLRAELCLIRPVDLCKFALSVSTGIPGNLISVIMVAVECVDSEMMVVN